MTRLAYYVAKSNTKLPEYAVWNQIAGTIDFVVHIDLVRNQGTGRPMRRVTSIREIAGLGEAGGVASTELFGLDDRRPVGAALCDRAWPCPTDGAGRIRSDSVRADERERSPVVGVIAAIAAGVALSFGALLIITALLPARAEAEPVVRMRG